MTSLDQFLTEDPLPPSRHHKTWGRRVVVLSALAGLIALTLGVFALLSGGSDSNDFEGSGEGEVSIVVERGQSLTAIGETLVSAGVVKTVEAFQAAAELEDSSNSIGPGRYSLRAGMSAEAALALMLDPASRADSRLVLPEGLRLDQTVDIAAQASGISRKQFERVLDNSEELPLPGWSESKPEGFLFPATYDLAGDESAETILSNLVKRFNQASGDLDLENRAAALGYSPYEIVIIASLVQAEVVTGDFAKAAAVVYNRLEAGMPLQFDSTVSYSLGIQELELSAEQLKTESPFNTYQNKGLPPTPINSPGEAALEAALAPAKGKWLYFVSVNPDTGETKFAKTYEKFLKLKDEYRDFLEANR